MRITAMSAGRRTSHRVQWLEEEASGVVGSIRALEALLVCRRTV